MKTYLMQPVKPWTKEEQEEYLKESGHDGRYWLKELRKLTMRNFERSGKTRVF